MTRFILHCVIAVLLTACATENEMLWDRPGWNEQQYQADVAQCRAQAFSVPGATQNLLQVGIVQTECMRGKGYHQRLAY